MNYCPNCGNKIEPGQNYCSNCGQKPPQEKPQKSQRTNIQKRNRWIIPVTIVLLIIAIGAIAGGVVIGLNSSGNTSLNSYNPIYTSPTPTSVITPTQTYQPSPTYTPTTHSLLSNDTVTAGYHNYHSYTIQSGKTISLSWSADGYVSVYVLTENQYDYFSTWGFHSGAAAYDSGSSGALSYYVANTDTYYLVIKNPSLFQNVKVYSATASW